MESYTIDSFIHMDITIHTIDSIFEKKCSSSWSYKQRSGRPHHGLVYSLDGNAIYYTEGREVLDFVEFFGRWSALQHWEQTLSLWGIY